MTGSDVIRNWAQGTVPIHLDGRSTAIERRSDPIAEPLAHGEHVLICPRRLEDVEHGVGRGRGQR